MSVVSLVRTYLTSGRPLLQRAATSPHSFHGLVPTCYTHLHGARFYHCGDDPVWYITTCHLVRFVYDLSVHHAFSTCRADFFLLGPYSPGDQLSESLTIIAIRHVLDKLQLALGTCPSILWSFYRLFHK